MTERYSQATFRQPRRDKLTPRIRDVVGAVGPSLSFDRGHTQAGTLWRCFTFDLDMYAVWCDWP